MLTDHEIELIKGSVPFLKEHGKTLATEFYKTMFSNNPEVKKYFNMDDQISGRQPLALSQSILAAANHIDNLSAILPVVERIGKVHCSKGIQPEHYPIVGKNLLITIKSMLGDSASEEFMAAWEKAYNEIAEIFIESEQKLYASKAYS